MCGRYTLHTPANVIAQEFELPEQSSFRPSYNVAPSQLVAVVALGVDGQTRGLGHVRWGLVPYWSQHPSAGPRPINARAEAVAFKFGESFREKRCLVPADGFFEWATEGKKKRARHFTLAGGGVLAFAGLWDVWTGEKEKVVTACMVATVKKFCSWLGLCPNWKKTGGRVRSSRTRQGGESCGAGVAPGGPEPAPQPGALGGFLRRMKGRLGAQAALTATAHKLARIVYMALRHGMTYVRQGQQEYEAQMKEKQVKALRRKARQLGLEVVEKTSGSVPTATAALVQG